MRQQYSYTYNAIIIIHLFSFRLIRGRYTSKAGSLLAYHPFINESKYLEELRIKEYCCDVNMCDAYFLIRPNDNGEGYSEPVGGMLVVELAIFIRIN